MPFLARQIFFKNWPSNAAEIACGSKISSKSLYLARFLRYKHFCVLQFFGKKFENSKWPSFLMRQNCFENWSDYSADIPYGSKILLKSLYLAQFSRYKHFCVFSIFAKNSKWPSFLVRQKFFENWDDYSADIPCGLKASSKTLSVVRCSRYKLLHILQFFAKNSKIQNGRHI